MAYADITFADKNILKRNLQKLRLKHALELVKNIPANGRVLDFGAGNGELAKHIPELRADVTVTCYEPNGDLVAEAKDNLKAMPDISVVQSLDDVSRAGFDLIYCMEVFEHLPPAETAAALASIRALLTKDGRVVIGVPNELYAVGLMKGLFRKARRKDYDTQLRVIVSAAMGKPSKDRPVGEFVKGMSYYFHHAGFDYRQLAIQLERDFKILETFGSPFKFAPEWMNSECYFVLKA